MYDLFVLTTVENSDRWKKIKSRFPHAKQTVVTHGLDMAYVTCARRSFTKMIWTIDSDITVNDDWTFDFMPEKWDQKYIHIWNTSNYSTGEIIDRNGIGTIKLWPREILLNSESPSEVLSNSGNTKEMEQSIAVNQPFDIMFISYEEETADINYQKLIARFPTSKRIHGIKGISNAHKSSASLASTKMFWSVDGDTIVDDSWDFSFYPLNWDMNYIHVWYSRNPINGLEYGYGAVKLWPTQLILDYNKNWLDFTTSVSSIKIMPETIATTAFNTSPYSTWKSAFREVIKLSVNISRNKNDVDSEKRLNTWLTVANTDQQHASWCLQGAADGVKWFANNDVLLINDFDWLKNYYNDLYGK